MTTKKKAKLKKTITGLLCLAALTSGMGVPAYLPSVFPSITAAAAEPDPVGENVIDLSKLVDYLSYSSALPEGVSVKHPENFDDIIEVTISNAGTYKLTGSNYINGAYLDVKFIIKANVTFICEDVFIKNDKEAEVIRGYDAPEGSYSSNTWLCSGYTIYNYVVPFVASDRSNLTLKGKLYIDTPFAEYPDGHIAAPGSEGNVSVPGEMQEVEFYELNNGTQLDKNYFIRYKADSSEENEYDIGEYFNINPYKCISVNGASKSKFSGHNPQIHLGEEHNIGVDGTCTQCHDTFTMRTVTIDDGSGTPTTKRVVDGKTIEAPEAPTTAPIGKKFDCWVDENGNNFDFTAPINADVTIYAKYSDSSIKSVAAVTAPTKNAYKEGGTFDPTGLTIKVTYEDDRSEDITYDESNTKFSFNPLLTAELSPSNEYVRVSYGTAMEGGSNYVDIPITVEAKLVTGIEIKTAPTKTAYIEGNKFDPTGLVITASYDIGKSEDITYAPENTQFKFSPALETALSPADTKITVTYGEKVGEGSNTLDIPINVAEKQVTGIAIKTEPTKTTYIEGEKFDPTGLVLTVTYDNGTTENVAYSAENASLFTFNPSGKLTTADRAVTITYGGKTTTQNITVAEKALASISVNTPPARTSYMEGNTFDPTGLVLSVTYEDSTTENVAYSAENASLFTFNPSGELEASDTSVTITYGGKTTEQAITVNSIPSPPSRPSSSSDSTTPTTPVVKEDNEPKIDGKSGWDNISDKIDKTPDGGTVNVDMNGTTELPKDIVKDIAGKNIDLVLDMGNGITWTINGKDVTNPKTVDLSVTANSKNIPVEVINNVTGEKSAIQISLAHNGDFGFTATLTIDLGSKNNGLYANLFYYNPKTKELEFMDYGKISGGKADLIFTHASDWTIVIDDKPMGGEDVSSGAGVFADNDSVDVANKPAVFVIPVMAAALFGAAVVSRKIRK
ncbi:MAG: bacterial Ig-like domain-containing protein [Oscillospiraceae bacterium]|nr:bacterial Ig-like domain-containing protein [Oscillospiraceae bacterium]